MASSEQRIFQLLKELDAERMRVSRVEAALEEARGDCAALEADVEAERAQAGAEILTLRAVGERAAHEFNVRSDALIAESLALRARVKQMSGDKAVLERALSEAEARLVPVDVIPLPLKSECRDAAVQSQPESRRLCVQGTQTDGPDERVVIAELRELLIASEQGRFEADLRLEEVLLEAEKQRLQGLLEVGKLRRAMEVDRDNMDQLARDLEGTFETLALSLAGGDD